MEYIVAPRDGSIPSCVACEIGHEKRQLVGGLVLRGNPCANSWLFVQAAHGAANGIATLQQLNESPAPDRAGSASY
jgi:hypothetical protein